MIANMKDGTQKNVGRSPTGYACASITLTASDATMLRRMIEHNPAELKRWLIQFEHRFHDNRYPNLTPGDT